jgi:hypothetical protein
MFFVFGDCKNTNKSTMGYTTKKPKKTKAKFVPN